MLALFGVLMFIPEKQGELKEKHVFLRNLFLYHCINMEKLIKIINNQKIKGKLQEAVLSSWINRKNKCVQVPQK